MFVYVAKFTDCDFLKIGWAVDCLKRIESHKVGFDYYYSIKLKNENQAKLFESLLHDAFQEKRVPSVMISAIHDGRSEFFTLCVLKDIEAVCKLLNLEMKKNKESKYLSRKKHKNFKVENKESIEFFVDGCIYALQSCYILNNQEINEIKREINKSLERQSPIGLFKVLEGKRKIP